MDASEGPRRVARLAIRSHLSAHRFPQPALRYDAVGVLVPELPAGRAYHHRRPSASPRRTWHFMKTTTFVIRDPVTGWLGLTIGALVLAAAALPEWAVEQAYSRNIYATLQAGITSFSNMAPLAL